MKPGAVVGVLLLVVAACGDAAGDAVSAPTAAAHATPAAPGPVPTTTTTTTTTTRPFDCPVTVPTETLSVPDTHPPAPSFGMWYGTADLWTVLTIDGSYAPRKGVFWSQNFPGGGVEERPDLTVTWQRLDVASRLIVEHPETTNAYTADEGWFMMAGIDPDEPGCWEVTATYKGATLSYVYSSG